jgi:uncharacterized pyridoxamine 5'-phosphate oxidase family protein
MIEVYEFLKESGVFFIATEEKNQPRVRPFGVVNLFEDKIYIQTGKKKNVSKQIQENSKIEICALKKDSHDTWIRIEAEAVRDDRKEPKKDLLDNNPYLRTMYSEDDDNTEVLYLKNVTARICSFTEEERVIKF